MGIDEPAGIFMVISSLVDDRRAVSVEERENLRGVEEVLHENGGKFDKVCRTARP